MKKARDQEDLILVGISSCLLGTKVRYDGGHKKDRYINDILGPYVRFVSVCPELEVGMGVPREAVRLEGELDAPTMVGRKSQTDWTGQMNRYSDKRVKQRDLASLSGYILKKGSPSCGMERVKVYGKSGVPNTKGVGLFARALLDRFPHLPVEEEGRLSDPRLRDNFIVRIFAYDRFQRLARQRFSRGAWVKFHTENKFLLLAHSETHYRKLGKLVAAIKQMSAEDFKSEYHALFMDGLKVKATVKKNVNVLQHIAGFLRDHLTTAERDNVATAISDYHKELVPLIVPITLIRHFVAVHDIEYVRGQVYLAPHPKELMLRNHV